MRASGTVRENGINSATKTMISHKKLKERGRGSFDYRCYGAVYVSKWNDCPYYSTHLPVRRCKRRVKGAARSRCNSASFLTQYNKGMAGVDLMERLLASYRPTIRGKKWYWPLFTNTLNIAVVPPLRHKQHKVTPPIIFETHYYDPLAKWNSEGIQGTERSIQRTQHMDRVTNHIPGTTPQGRCKVCIKKHKIIVHKMPN